jgi:hypothetical protein
MIAALFEKSTQTKTYRNLPNYTAPNPITPRRILPKPAAP